MSNIWGLTVQNLARYTFLTLTGIYVLTELLIKHASRRIRGASLTHETNRRNLADRRNS